MVRLTYSYFFLVIFWSCNEVPQFTSTNLNDPFRKGFIPPIPQELETDVNNPNTNYYEIRLSWRMPLNLKAGISGFVIYKSNESYDQLYLLNEPEIRSWDNIYYYDEVFTPEDSLDYYFKVQSYFIQELDTVYSEPVFANLVDWEYFCRFCPTKNE